MPFSACGQGAIFSSGCGLASVEAAHTEVLAKAANKTAGTIVFIFEFTGFPFLSYERFHGRLTYRPESLICLYVFLKSIYCSYVNCLVIYSCFCCLFWLIIPTIMAIYKILHNHLICAEKHILTSFINTLLIQPLVLPRLGYAPGTHPLLSYRS
ncbi:hypothetical protein SDC9_184939 [bioreactor metagenome]|uniref:Uncharacterized protein n=1 Tax=bioreactor metagenome TaxID=1076179 RepID=A0A645HEI2_9ZZZZ